MTRDARGAWCTEGRRLLLALLQTTTARELAAACRVRPQAITKLARGETHYPAAPLLLALADRFGIEPHTWCRPASKTTAVVANPGKTDMPEDVPPLAAQ